MTGPRKLARGIEQRDDPYHRRTGSMMGDDQAGFPTPSVTPIGHNPIVTDTDYVIILPLPTGGSMPSDMPDFTASWALSFPTTFATSTLSTSTTTNTAMPDNSASPLPSPSPSPSPLSSDGSSYSPATSGIDHASYPPEQSAASRHRPPIAAIAVVPVVLLLIVGAIVFFYMRKRRKQRQIAAVHAQAQAEEMKATSSTVQAYVSSPLPPTRPLSQPTLSQTRSPPLPSAPEPVILGPITGTNNNYFTGIDTSDIMSVRSNERASLGNPFADNNSLNEEPPPPYYPRSIAPLSRDTSLRVSQPAPPAFSQTERSPFDDPIEDDAVSDVSGPTLRHDRDDVSAVSDLSYQQEPVVRRAGV